MAIQKNFKIANGLEVNDNLIFADKDQNTVGIGTTVTQEKLQVIGGIGATDLVLSGVGTIPVLKSTDALISNGYINVGVVTSITGTGLTYTTGNLGTLEAATGNIVTGVVTTVSGTNLTYTNGNITVLNSGTVLTPNLYAVSGIVTNGTVTNLTGVAATITGVSGNVKIGTGTTALVVEGDTRVTGILTVGTSSLTLNGETNQINGVTISSGIVTATTFSGDLSLSDGSASAPSIKFSSSTTTGIYSPGTNQFAITTNGVGRITIDASGNIVAGGTLTAGSFIPTSSTVPTNGLYSPGTNQLALSTNGTGRLFVDSNGQIGINATPSYRLDVNTGTNNRVRITDSGSATLGLVRTGAKSYLIQSLGDSALRLYDETAGSERLRITSAGLMGIGTSSPDVGLHYRGDQPKLRIESSNELGTAAGTEEIGRLEWEGFRNTNFNAAASIRARQDGTWSTNTAWLSPTALEFYTQNNTGVEVTSPRLTIDSTGRVGIGTTSPTSVLHVSKVGAEGYEFIPGDSANVNRTQHYNRSTSAYITHASRASEHTWEISATGEKARIDSSGRLLVGTSSSFQIENTITPRVISANNTGSGDCADLFVGSFQNATGSGRARVSGKLFLAHSRSGVTGSIGGLVANNDRLGEIRFVGDDGAQFLTAAEILAEVDGTPGTNDMPGRLVFSTTADGASSPTERMRITSAGLIGIGTSTPQKALDIYADSGLIVHSTSSNSVETPLFIGGGATSQRKLALIGKPVGTWARQDLLICSNNVQDASEVTSADAVVTIKSTGNVGIGTTSPSTLLHTSQASGFNIFQQDSGSVGNYLYADSTGQGWVGTRTNHPFVFGTNNSERMRLDTSGRLLVGTSSAQSVASGGLTPQFQLNSSNSSQSGSTLGIFANSASNNCRLALYRNRATTGGGFDYTGGTVQTNDVLGQIDFAGVDGQATPVMRNGATISAACESTPTGAEMPSRLVFSTTADGASSPTERVRIDNAGHVLVAQSASITPGASNTTLGLCLNSNGTVFASRFDTAAAQFNVNADAGLVLLRRSGVQVGSISVTTTATAYNTSSDYRLKENVTPVTDGITRLQQLKPSRFNFIADPDKTVDGFLAHEVQTIVPEAITGEKDAVDNEGNPQYQGIDQSKLVPLLTAALQEAIGRIETLEAEVAALKAS